MPLVTQCQSCRKKLRVPENLVGKMVKCPACKQPFRVEAEEDDVPVVQAERVDDDPEEEDRRADEDDAADEEEAERKPSRGRPKDWRKVHTGLTLMLVAIALVLLIVPLAFIGAIVLGPLVAIPVGVMALCAGITSLVGIVFCVAAPPKHNAKTFATVAVGLAVVSILLSGLQFLSVPRPVQMLSAVSGLAQVFVFLFFLRAVARCMKSHDLESSVGKLIVLNGVLVGLYLVMLAMTLAVGPPPQPGVPGQPAGAGGNVPVPPAPGAGIMALGAVGCVVAILAIVWLIWYVRILSQTRSAVGRYLARR